MNRRAFLGSRMTAATRISRGQPVTSEVVYDLLAFADDNENLVECYLNAASALGTIYTAEGLRALRDRLNG